VCLISGRYFCLIPVFAECGGKEMPRVNLVDVSIVLLMTMWRQPRDCCGRRSAATAMPSCC
jgi:hypothetical protein